MKQKDIELPEPPSIEEEHQKLWEALYPNIEHSNPKKDLKEPPDERPRED